MKNHDGSALVHVEGFVRRYGELTAVDSISFAVAAGETFGLIGPDGAGKTTTLRCVLGLIAPDAGTLLTCSMNPHRRRRDLSRRVGYLSQHFSLYGDLSIDENLAFFGQIHGVRGWRARRDELLEMLRLEPFRGRLADHLSGGMKQKLALACTLIHTPELLVLDEPTTGVDPISRRDFWKILGRLQAQGLTILLTTPYLDEAERCGRVALLDHGRLLTVADPEALRADLPGTLLEILARPKRRALELLCRDSEVSDVQLFGERLHVRLPGVTSAGSTKAAGRVTRLLSDGGVEVQGVRPTTPSLEDVFIAKIREADAGAADGEVRR